MPHTKDGRRVDLQLNMLAVINRTTAQVLIELFVNGCAYQVQQHMKTLSTYEEKETMLFDFINIFNEKQCKHFYKDYAKMSAKKKKEYIDSAINDGIYIHLENLNESTPVFYRCIHALEKFPFIKEDDLYITKWGREIKCLTKSFIGEMYIMKLKQSDRRGFSARSSGAIDTRSLPIRSFKSKKHLEQKSSSCIRFGEYETLKVRCLKTSLIAGNSKDNQQPVLVQRLTKSY